ncbi:MAG: T9SS type A sorting domain-containing protein [Candidatus Stahlbacteria bacterium]|nr:T9SS type A sorting domain-containing protein [Candidatus Stahlbacteria bacterium]
MRKYFVFIVLVLPIYAMGENVIFNPGFDMTPWDTGWTIETDTAVGGSCNTEIAEAQAIPDTGKSPPNCCGLSSYVKLDPYPANWCGGTAYAETKVYQIFNEISSCSVKAQIKYLGGGDGGGSYNEGTIDVQVNGTWQTIWGKGWETDTIWSNLSIGVNNPITGIRFRTKSYLYCSSLGSSAVELFYFWVDDIYVGQAGVEESKELEMKSEKLKAFPNPFVIFTEVRGQRTENRIQVYDMMGRLVEKTKESIIGENLHPGFYFVKAKGYKPIKVIKLGDVK